MFEGAGLAVHTYPYYDAGDRRRSRSTRCCEALRSAAGEERRAAARLLPQPDRRRPDARAVGRADPAAAPSASCCRTSTSPTRASATASTRTPTRCARSPRRAAGRPAAQLLRRQLVLEEHEPVRRALRRAERRLRRRRRRRATCSASSSSRCGATTRARRSTAARSSPRVLTEPGAARAPGRPSSARCASASWRCARRCTACCAPRCRAATSTTS